MDDQVTGTDVWADPALNEPVPYAPVDVDGHHGLRLPADAEKAIVDALASAADTWTRGASSAAGLQTIVHGPTIPSGGAVTKPNPVPSDDATTHVLDRIPGEPSPLDLDPAYGFTAAADVDSSITWYERPTIWITPEQYRTLGEPQQIAITIRAVTR